MAEELANPWLKDIIQWYCQECKHEWFQNYPPKCPKCGATELNSAWAEQERRRHQQAAIDRINFDADYWAEARRKKEYQERRKQAYQREKQQLQETRRVRNADIIKMLEELGIPLPEDERAYGQAHSWTHQPQHLRRFFQRYNYWARQVDYLTAARQAKWEIGEVIVRMRATGMSVRKIADEVGLAHHRVQVICERERRRKKWREYEEEGNYTPRHMRSRSPVEQWLEDEDWKEEFGARAKRSFKKWLNHNPVADQEDMVEWYEHSNRVAERDN